MRLLLMQSDACSRMRRLVHAYVDNELSAETTIDVMTHLSGCAECASLYRETERLKARLRAAVGTTPAPASMAGEVRRLIRAAAG